jgi:hypothetical protein
MKAPTRAIWWWVAGSVAGTIALVFSLLPSVSSDASMVTDIHVTARDAASESAIHGAKIRLVGPYGPPVLFDRRYETDQHGQTVLQGMFRGERGQWLVRGSINTIGFSLLAEAVGYQPTELSLDRFDKSRFFGRPRLMLEILMQPISSAQRGERRDVSE